MRERVARPMALMIIGLIVGASSFGWWFLMGSAAAVYASLLAGHLAVALGFAQRRTRRRLILAALLTLCMWWPVPVGDLIWAWGARGGGPPDAARAWRPAGRLCPPPRCRYR